MAAKGFYLVQGDRTTCGGRITTGAEDHTLFDKPVAREQDSVTCGKHAGLYKIAGGIDNDTIHGRRMAGTLDSCSTCPCKAKFIPSMMNDTYEKGGECITTLFSLNGLMASLQEPYKNLHPENKTERQCTHTDGAIKVAEYILSEIKANVRSDTAETIRYLIDEDFIIKRLTEWNKLPFYARLGPPPKTDLLAAMAIWYQTVKTGSIWDHKPKIRDFFSSVAVARPLPRKGKSSKSYYHKFKQHDYFYDVWSNIHYGYVGRSVGFSEAILLKGSTWEQNMTPGAMGDDTMDDITSMKIGFNLFYEHGEFAETLTADNILCVLETTPGAQLPHSRENHWCWNTDNPEKSDESF